MPRVEKLKALLQLIRPSNCILSFIATFIGASIASGGVVFSFNSLLASLVAFLMAGGGIVANDICDYEADKINAPHRPLPSGRIKLREAEVYSALLLGAGLTLSYPLGLACFTLAFLNAVLELLYAAKLKRVAFIANLTDSWFVASCFLFGALAIDVKKVGLVFIPSLLAFLANVGREIHGDLEDVEGDKRAGIKTLPLVKGVAFSRRLANAFIALAVLLSPLPYLLGVFNFNYLFLVLIADCIFIASMFMSPSQNQRYTKLAMLIALFSFLAGLVRI